MAKKFYTRPVGLTVLALAITPGIGSEEVWAAREIAPRVVPGQTVTSPLAEKARVDRATPRRVDTGAAIRHEMRLEPLAESASFEKSEPVKGIGTPLRIGTHRELPAAFKVAMGARDLEWEPARGGGEVAVFSVISPGAKALRLALDVERLPGDAEVRFYAPAANAAEAGVFAANELTSRLKSGASEPFWSPVVHGETAVVEIWVPAWRRGSDVRLSVARVSHIYRSLDGKDLDHIGGSGSCNRDIECLNKWTEAADAVAKIVFEVGGGSALCSGQLLNNQDGKYLFVTAAHCISSRGAAGSTTFFWRFKRAACGGANPTSVLQTGGGGKLLFTSSSASRGLDTDHTLMLLKRDPTTVLGTVNLLGWMVGDSPDDQVRQKVHGIHHPAGDVQRGSRGKVQDTWRLERDGSLSSAMPATHYQVGWNKGTTEGGSSGSAILTGKKWPNQFVIGVLTGGFASCSQRREPDFYGAFEETFRRFKKFRKHFD